MLKYKYLKMKIKNHTMQLRGKPLMVKKTFLKIVQTTFLHQRDHDYIIPIQASAPARVTHQHFNITQYMSPPGASLSDDTV